MASIKRQIYNTLGKMTAFGESRHEAKQRARDESKPLDFYTKDKIYSHKTFNNYVEIMKRGADYALAKDPSIKDIKDIKPYMSEWINSLIDEGKSAWTVSTYTAAINKFFGTSKDDYEYKEVKRNLIDIEKNRPHIKETEIRYNPDNYKSELTFSRCFGLRASELRNLKIEQIKINENSIEVKNVKGKGGKIRNVRFYGSDEERAFILDDINNKKAKGQKRMFPSFTKELKIHRERQEYAKRVYKHHERAIDSLDRKETITPRKGANKGHTYDRQALKIASQMLGHERIEIVYQHYLSA